MEMTLVKSHHASLENKRYGNRGLGPDTALLKLEKALTLNRDFWQ
jgi:hypothetical protein